MRIATSEDRVEIESILTDPSVAPYIGGVPDIDLILSKCLVYLGEHGLFVLDRKEEDVFELHTAIKKQGRGKWASAALDDLISFCFTATRCRQLITKIDGFDTRSHAIRTFASDHGFTEFGSDGDVTFHQLSVLEWMLDDRTLSQCPVRYEPVSGVTHRQACFIAATCWIAEMMIHKAMYLYQVYAPYFGCPPLDFDEDTGAVTLHGIGGVVCQ